MHKKNVWIRCLNFMSKKFNRRLKIMIVIGTRPEAIKMLPIIFELGKNKLIEPLLCVTGQHNELTNEVLEIFGIKPDFDLRVMKKNQNLFDITSKILVKLKGIYELKSPDLVMVHGDTTTAFASSLAAYYLKIDIAHIEAGLRTYDIYSPFPEEFNRQAISLIAKFHFSPTDANRDNLLKMGVEYDNIFVTGNTLIDFTKISFKSDFKDPILDWLNNDKLIIFTAHRREIFGDRMKAIFEAINYFMLNNEGIKLLFSVHPNPNIQLIASQIFDGNTKVMLSKPLNVIRFHNLIARSHLIVTDSGGLQEEAPAFNIPVLVIRDTTERTEAINAGTVKLIGTCPNKIIDEIRKLLEDSKEYNKMKNAINPYGDGTASKVILNILIKEFNL